MLIQKRYYKWDDSKFEFPIKLGQTKSELVNSGLITEIKDAETGKTNYTGVNGTPWRINFHNDLVDQIWFNHENDFIYNTLDLKDEVMRNGEKALQARFEIIDELTNKNPELKDFEGKQVLYVVLGDFVIRMIALIDKK